MQFVVELRVSLQKGEGETKCQKQKRDGEKTSYYKTLAFNFIFTYVCSKEKQTKETKMEITKLELENIYYKNDNKFVCNKFGISLPTLISYLNKAGIKLKGKGNKKAKSKIKIV